MQAKNTNKVRQFSSLLNEHWKRKQRLKGCQSEWPEKNSTSPLRWISRSLNEFSIVGSELSQKRSLIDIMRTTPSSLLESLKAPEDELEMNPNYCLADLNQILARQRCFARSYLVCFALIMLLVISTSSLRIGGQQIIQSDPRPTIYSGQVSFGLLLSAHSSKDPDVTTSASYQVQSILASEDPDYQPEGSSQMGTMTTSANSSSSPPTTPMPPMLPLPLPTSLNYSLLDGQLNADSSQIIAETISGEESRNVEAKSRKNRQIFDRAAMLQRRQQQHQQQQQQALQFKAASAASATTPIDASVCSTVNPNALYAGMGAIWASHQANLVGDSHLAVGTYVYDSCNDLDIGQRQSVRIVSNLNAFQQTTCESPRGAPISLTIAHGDNQLRAIQLLTSFRVPVITTREHFDLEDYNELSLDQRKYLFTTAPSSRHLAVGALRFTKLIVKRSTSSPKLLNRSYQRSSKNGLIVISRNLPSRFIAYLSEVIPRFVNYEMMLTNQPIDHIRSLDSLESVLVKGASSTSESRLSSQTVSAPSSSDSDSDSDSDSNKPPSSDKTDQASQRRRRKRDDSSDDDSDSVSDSDGKMLSPTILMFITPSEALDLVTRLRNDLAEVSRYYSLIVTTREDISPALQTIFHRGGSRLCSGKAFYTISPKPNDINEFNRYFKDTVQMEGESSDHPLICEFAKHQSGLQSRKQKLALDLDDISTEPVIKAVWSAAAAFKSVHKKECSALVNSSPASNLYESAGPGETGLNSASASSGSSGGRVMSSRQSGKSAHSECMVKMNKNMATLVQRALRKLDVVINSTGLQSLDGFRIKFDDVNELMTNDFSIKYINKECDITEIGRYTGERSSALKIEEDALSKSLESTLPDPWPIRPPPVPSTPAPSIPAATSKTSTAAEASSTPIGDSTNKDSSSTVGDSGGGNSDVNTPNESGETGSGRGKRKLQSINDEGADSESSSKPMAEDDEASAESDSKSVERPSADMEAIEGSSAKRPSKRSRLTAASEQIDRQMSRRNKPEEKQKSASSLSSKKKRLMAAPVTAMGGRGIMPGVTDTEPVGGDSDRATSATTKVSSTGEQEITHHPSNFPTTTKPMRKLKPFPSNEGTTLEDWLPMTKIPTAGSKLLSTIQPTRVPTVISGSSLSTRLHDDEQVDSGSTASGSSDLKTKGTTEAPVFSTLPESGGNADLEAPVKSQTRVPKSTKTSNGKPLEVSATTEASDYVTSSSISKKSFDTHSTSLAPSRSLNNFNFVDQIHMINQTTNPRSVHDSGADIDSLNRHNYFKDLNSSPVPIGSTSTSSQRPENLRYTDQMGDQSKTADALKEDNRTLRTHLRWIYGSWFGISILGANICGALLTLYVLTFLLMKNCDGSLDRENQSMRSMHLLAIIVVFFGSTLFIVYPTPGLCLLRTSWHNFALVMLFGTLLLHAMQVKSLNSLGLGGRPNRLNQFLTLVFMVGVQVSFELQRWKYESANYINFVNQYFGSTETSHKLSILSSTIANQFNPLNAFNDQVTPVSIQVSEQYQNLLHDYCTQRADDFLSNQLYLCFIVCLLVIFSISIRKSRRRICSPSSDAHQKLTSALTSGKLVASQHEANLNLTSASHFQFATNTAISNSIDTGNMFMVTIISAPIYSISIILHIYGQNSGNRDLISSVTMILIAFSALIGIFLPILLQIHRFDSLVSDRLPGTLSRPVMTQSKLQQDNSPSSPSTAFTMFPEFAPTGLRRPSSTSGDSSSGGGSRRPFAETKESRRNMGVALANLGPSADSLRSMGFYNTDRNPEESLDPALLNLKLNLNANDESVVVDADTTYPGGHNNHQHHNQYTHHHQPASRRTSKNEKRLIMLDVDPCCPRHGVVATRPTKSNEIQACRGGNKCSSHCHQ